MSALAYGREDPTLRPRVLARRSLHYGDGGDHRADRSPHVRAASGLAWARIGGQERLVIAQDDASHLAVVDPFADPAEAHALALDHVVEGRRVFESRLGNKRHKLDLEAVTTLEIDGVEHVLVVGSGSLPVRERLVLVGPEGQTRIVDARSLYAALRAETAFAGSELNVEGAVRRGDRVVLLQRGNGAPAGDLAPTDATCEIDAAALAAYLTGGPVPRLEAVTPYDLGAVGGVRLTFTDATRIGSRIVFLAGAEDSPDAIDDGTVAGVALGVLPEEPGTPARWGLLRDLEGAPYLGKAEGIAPHRRDVDDGRFWAVVDRDDPDHAAELLLVELG